MEYTVGMKRMLRRRAKKEERSPVAATGPRRDVQYTVRNVPWKADQALRRKAAELKVSLNEVLRQALLKEAGMAGVEGQVHHDLDGFIGSWQEDPEFDAIIAEQDRLDEEKWK